MKDKDLEINKLYYSMGEVTKMFDANPSQIRFYEKEFDILKPKKNKKGNRLFSQKDIGNLKIIFSLIKEKGYTIQGARDYLRNNKKEIQESQQIIDRKKLQKCSMLTHPKSGIKKKNLTSENLKRIKKVIVYSLKKI